MGHGHSALRGRSMRVCDRRAPRFCRAENRRRGHGRASQRLL